MPQGLAEGLTWLFPTYLVHHPSVEEEGRSRHWVSVVVAVEFHENLCCGTGHAEFSLAGVDVVAPGQEIRAENWVVKHGLQYHGLVAGLSHVPQATSRMPAAGVLVGVVADISLCRLVWDPLPLPICRISESLFTAEYE